MNLACQWQPGIAITINHQESQCPQDQLKQTAGKSKLYPESSMPPTYMDITWLLIPLTALLLLVPSQDIPHTLSAVTPYSLRIYTTMLWGLNFMCTSDEFFIISDKFALLTQDEWFDSMLYRWQIISSHVLPLPDFNRSALPPLGPLAQMVQLAFPF